VADVRRVNWKTVYLWSQTQKEFAKNKATLVWKQSAAKMDDKIRDGVIDVRNSE
jgi:hypothetical protein